MKKWKIYWSLITFVFIAIHCYINGSSEWHFRDGENLAVILFASIVSGGVLFAIRKRSWISGSLVAPDESAKGFRLNRIQRAISLATAGFVSLVQAKRVGVEGFEGVAWMLGLGLSIGLVLIATQGLYSQEDS